MITAKLVGGPSKEEMIKSLKSAHGPSESSVKFIAEDGVRYIGVVEALSHADVSGEKFDFSGRFNGRYLRGQFDCHEHQGSLNLRPIVGEFPTLFR